MTFRQVWDEWHSVTADGRLGLPQRYDKSHFVHHVYTQANSALASHPGVPLRDICLGVVSKHDEVRQQESDRRALVSSTYAIQYIKTMIHPKLAAKDKCTTPGCQCLKYVL